MENLSLFPLFLIFVGAAIAVWMAGIQLSNATDVLSTRWKLGEALGGLIMLAIVTNLPEIAITVSGALSHNLDIAVGNILGGIALQTVVLVLLDAFGIGKSAAFTYRAASLTLVVEGVLVMAVLTVTVMGTQLPDTLIFARVSPSSLAIALLWIAGLWLVGKARTSLPWHENGRAPLKPGESGGASEQKKKTKAARDKKAPLGRTLAIFGAGAVVTLVCGVLLANSGEAIAKHVGMSGVLFGATALAAATSLPELSTGLAAVKLGDNELAFSDIFGGNAFLPVLFLVADVISGQAVLPHAHKTDIYLTGLGILLTAVYVTGLLFRPRRQIARLGLDSLLVLIFYVLGVLGLVALSHSPGA